MLIIEQGVKNPDSGLFLSKLEPDEAKQGEAFVKFRNRLLSYFRKRRMNNSSELADEVIQRLVEKVHPEIENVLAFAYAIARNVLLESLRSAQKEVPINEAFHAAESEQCTSERLQCLRECLAKDTPENKELIEEYYSQNGAEKIALHKKMSRKLDVSPAGLRMKVMRLKRSLASCIETCLGEVS